jgi:MtN3 and saliva related transmembrane protein
MENQIAEIVGYAAGILRMVSFVPQLVKTLKTRKADDLSVPTLLMMVVTTSLFIIYGVMKDLTPVVVTLSVLLAMLLAQIFFTVKYSGTGSQPSAAAASSARASA